MFGHLYAGDLKLADWLISNPQEVTGSDGLVWKVYVAELNSMDEFSKFFDAHAQNILITPSESMCHLPLPILDIEPYFG